MILKSEIQEKLSAVAKGNLSPWDFHVWLEDSSWNMHQGSPEDAIELVGDVKFVFEQYYQRQIDERQLIEHLISLIDYVIIFDGKPNVVQVNVSQFRWESSSSAVLLTSLAMAPC